MEQPESSIIFNVDESDGANHDFRTEISCVKFPGVVKDSGVHRAIQALGGNAAISQALSKGQKMELNFNADSMFHKPVFGDKEKVDAILLKVKKNSNEARVVGVIKDSYTFKSLCDFQFLPSGDPDTSVFPLSSVANPTTLLESSTVPPLYVTATSLSKMDTPSMYSFSNRSLVVSGRASRRNHTQRVPFSLSAPLPSVALPGAIKMVEVRKMQSVLATVRELFAKRPIWTRAALMAAVNVEKNNLVVCLPCVAFFFLGGPWRLTWCRHGYDPRIDPASKLWQTVEFRAQSVELRKHLKLRPAEKDDPVFREGQIPAQINCMYQLEDLQVKEIQDLVSETHYNVCQEKLGWINAATIEKIRKIIDDRANEAVILKFGRSAPLQQTDEQEDSDDSLVVLSNQSAESSDEVSEVESDDD